MQMICRENWRVSNCHVKENSCVDKHRSQRQQIFISTLLFDVYKLNSRHIGIHDHLNVQLFSKLFRDNISNYFDDEQHEAGFSLCVQHSVLGIFLCL